MDAQLQNENDMSTVPFTKLPTDLLFEIFKLLNPFDLLQLARTSKALRIILMNRSSQLIWAEAQSNVKGLPKCPNILSQPAYAELMFNESCSQCLASSPTVVSWGFLSRWCKVCAESEFDTVKVKYKVGNLSLTSFLPHVSFFCRGKHAKTVTLYHTESRLRWRELSRSEREAWVLQKASAWEENGAQIIACRIWLQRRNRKQRKLDRKHLHTANQLELGQKIKACQPLLIQIREDYARSNPVNTIIPPRANIYKHFAPFRTLIRSTQQGTSLTLGDFREAIDQLPSLIPTWIDMANARLLQRMQRALGTSSQFGVSDLALATALFDCTLCGTERLNREPCDKLISYPRVLVHRGAVKDSDCAKHIYAHGIHPIEYWTDQSLYNDHDTIRFSKDVYDLVTSLVKLCGLDPLTTTAHEMDKLDPIFASIDGLNSSIGPHFYMTCMTWRRTVLHLKQNPGSQVELVEGDTRINAKKLLFDEQTIRWTTNQSHICVHCREKGNLVEIQNHVQERHGCTNPTNDDFVVAMDADIILDAVRV